MISQKEINDMKSYKQLNAHKQLIAEIFIEKLVKLEHEGTGPVEDLANYSIVCAGILIGKMKEHFEESIDEPSEDIKYVPASIDFSKIPKELDGQWIIVNRHTQELLGHDFSIEKAIKDVNVWEHDLYIVIAKAWSKALLGGMCTAEPAEKNND